MIFLSKYIRKNIFIFGLFYSFSSFAFGSSALSAKYLIWENSYLALGITPTELEVRAAGKKIGFGAPQIAYALKHLQSREVAEVISSVNNLRNLYSQNAHKAQSSKSVVTADMARKVLSLLDEVNSEKETRDVENFKLTNKQLKDVFALLAKRIDAERDAEKMKEMMLDMSRKDAPFEYERFEISRQIDLLYKKESDENFDSAGFMKNLAEKFNEHINKVNTALHH